MNNYLGITDPDEMHAAVDRKLHDDSLARAVADWSIDGITAAMRYAPHNKHLRQDPWIERSIAQVATSADNPWGLPPLEDEAVIAVSNHYSVESTEADDGWHRTVYPLRSEGGPHDQTSQGLCHSCELKLDMTRLLGDIPVEKPLTTFHIAAGRFVVEFKVCDECSHHLSTTYGPITQVVVQRGPV